MLLALLKKSRKAGYFLFPFFIGVAWLKHLLEPFASRLIEGEAGFGLYGIIHDITGEDLRLKTIMALVLLIVNGILLFRIYREYLFPNTWSMLPAVLYVLLTSGNPGYQSLHPVWLATPFLLASIDRLFAAFDIRKPYGYMFNSGFFLGVGTLFYPFLLGVFPAFLAGSRMMGRDARWREPALLFLGMVIPWIFMSSAYFLTDRFTELAGSLVSMVSSDKGSILSEIPLMVYFIFTGLLTLAGSFMIIRQQDNRKVSFRKFYTFFFFLFLFSTLSFILVPAVNTAMILVVVVPVTFLLSNYFDSLKRKYTGEVIFLLLIAMVVFIQMM